MADVKISNLPPDTLPQLTDYFVIVDRTANTTKYVQVQNLDNLYALLTGTQTLTNTEVQKRVNSVTSIATSTINADTTDLYIVTAQGQAITFANPTGSPAPGQTLLIRIKDNGTSFGISYGTTFRAIGVTLPTTTLGSSKVMYLGMVWNAQDSSWDVLSVGRQA